MRLNAGRLNKAMASRSAHCVRKSWVTKRRNDRIHKLRRVAASADSDWSNDDDDDAMVVPWTAKETDAWEEEQSALLPRLVLPPPLVRQSTGFGLVPAMLEAAVSFDCN